MSEGGLELASVGRPLRGFDVEIRRDGVAVADGIIGRIWASGPSIMDRYLDNSPPPVDDGWLDTGDLGFIHEGELYVTGRAKDVLIVRGRNHDPVTLETAIDGMEGVRTGCSAAVASLSDRGEHIVLFVETRPPVPGDVTSQINASVRAATGIVPDEVVLLSPGTLPRTSSGKIRRAETLLRWQTNRLSAPEDVSAVRLMGAVAKSAWSEWRGRQDHHD